MKNTIRLLAVLATVISVLSSPTSQAEDFISGPHWLGGQFLPAYILDLAAQDDALYACCADGKIYVFDLADSDHPQLVDAVALPETRQRIVLQHDGFLYVAGDSTLSYVDARDPLHPRWVGTYPEPIAVRAMAMDHGFAAACVSNPCCLVFLDASNPANLVPLDQLDVPAQIVAIVGDVVVYSVNESDYYDTWSILYSVVRRDLKRPRAYTDENERIGWSINIVQGMEVADGLVCKWFHDHGPPKLVEPSYNNLRVLDVAADGTLTQRSFVRLDFGGAANTGGYTPSNEGQFVVPFADGKISIVDVTGAVPILEGWASTGPVLSHAVRAADHIYGCCGDVLHVLAVGDLSRSLIGPYNGDFRDSAFDGRRRAYTIRGMGYYYSWAGIYVHEIGASGELTRLVGADVPEFGDGFGEVDLHADLVVMSGVPTYTLDLGSSTPSLLHEQTLSFRDFAAITPEIGAAATASGLLVLDLENPAELSLVATVPGSLMKVEPAPGATPFAVGVSANGETRIFDLTNADAPIEVARFGINVVRAVPVDGSRLLAVTRQPVSDCLHARLDLYDLTVPAAPQLRGSLDVPGLVEDALRRDDRLYLACESGGLVAIDIADTTQPIMIGGLAANDVRSLVLTDGDLLVADQKNVERVDLDDDTAAEFALTEFSGTYAGGQVHLAWRTAIAPATTVFQVRRVGSPSLLPVTRTSDGWEAFDTLPSEFTADTVTYELRARLAPAQDWFVAATTTVTLDVPTVSRLLAACPNPFNPQTVLRYELAAAAPFTIHIHDARGRCIRHLAAGEGAPGIAEISWDGRDDAGRALPTGTYLARLITDEFTTSLKLTMMR